MQKLNELEEKGISSGSRYMAQQERVTAARVREKQAVLDARAALDGAASAQKRYDSAQRSAASGAANLGAGLRSVSSQAQSASRSAASSFGQIPTQAGVAGQQSASRFAAGLSSIKTQTAAILGSVGITAGVAALGTAFTKSVQTGMDFTNALNTMRAVSGATGDQIEQVSAKARQLGTDNSLAATSSVDAANAMLELAKGGFSVDQSMQASRGTLQLAAAAQIDAAQAATIQSQALQAFGLNADYAGTAADILANAANQSSAEITDVAYAFQASGAVAHQFGLSMQDTAATISMLANAGIKGSDAGTLLKSALLALTDQGQPAQSAIEELGLTVYDANGKFEGMSKLFGQLQTASQRMTAEQYQAATATLFGSDAARIAGIAAQQGSAGFDRMSGAMGRGGAAAEVAAAKMSGLPGAWEQLKNSAQDAALSFYDAVQGPLTSGAKAGAEAIEGLTGAAKDAAPIVKAVFAPLAPIVSGLTSVLGEHTSVIVKLAAAYVGLRVVRSVSDSLTAGFANVRAGVTAAEGATSLFGRTIQSIGGAGGAVTNAGQSVKYLSSEFSMAVQATKKLHPELSTTAARLSVLRENGVTARGAMSGLRSAGSGLATMIGGATGGPLGLALAGGTLALGWWADKQAKAAQQAENTKERIRALTDEINWNTGALTDNGKAQVYKTLNDQGAFTNARRAGIDATIPQIQAAGEGDQAALALVNQQIDQRVSEYIANNKSKYITPEEERRGVTAQDYTAALRGNSDAQKTLQSLGVGDGTAGFWSEMAQQDFPAATRAALDLSNALGTQNDELTKSRANAKQEAEALGTIKQNLTGLASQFENQDKGFSVKVDTTQVAGTEDQLKALGFTIETMPDGQVKITADTDTATHDLQILNQTISALPPGKEIDTSAPGGQDVLTLMKDLGIEVHENNEKHIQVDAPLAPAVIEQLKALGIEVNTNNGKTILVTADDTDYQTKKNNDWLQTITKRIVVQEDPSGQSTPPDTRPKPTVPDLTGGHADGGIVAFADGGVRAKKLTDPAVLPGRGKGTLFETPAGQAIAAEGSTKVESWIPWAPNKRDRATDILATTAAAFGYVLVPGGDASVSGYAGAITANAVKAVGSLAGDRVPRFADGGIVTGQQLRDLAMGQGASRPLTGAPYVRGGVNWGDCSGSMSAFARYAAGLPPFGGRFSTATEADYLLKLGAKTGSGPSGSLRFGWVNGGPGGGHTAGTLPDGTNIEMGGSYGGGMVGGNVGADDAQFTDRAYMVVKDADKYSGGASSGTSTSDSAGSTGSTPDSSSGSGYTFDPLTSDTSQSGDTSISGRVSEVFAAAVKGQIEDVFSVFSVNDSPGWLAALTEYERSRNEDARKNYEAEKKKLDQDYQDAQEQRKSDFDDSKESIDGDYQAGRISAAERDARMLALQSTYDSDELNKRHDYENAVVSLGQRYGQVDGDSVRSLSLKQRFESDNQKAGQQYERDRYAREAQYDRDEKSLESLRDSKAISQSEFEQRSQALKAQYDADVKGLKDRYASTENQLKSTFDRSQSQFAPKDRYLPNTATPGVFHPTDPGTKRPAADEDLNTGGDGASSSGAAGGGDVKAAFRLGMREAWRQGQPWTDTDYIIDHESGWKMDAVNPSSGAFGGPQFLGATLEKYLPSRSTDPTVQGTAYDHYVGDRYQTPMNARVHWDQEGWYDVGGTIHEGVTLMKNGLGHKETALPFEPGDILQALNQWGDARNAMDSVKGLDRMAAGGGRGGNTFITQATFRDEKAYYERQAQERRLDMARHGGRWMPVAAG